MSFNFREVRHIPPPPPRKENERIKSVVNGMWSDAPEGSWRVPIYLDLSRWRTSVVSRLCPLPFEAMIMPLPKGCSTEKRGGHERGALMKEAKA